MPEEPWTNPPSPDFQLVNQALSRYGRQILGLGLIVVGLALFLAQVLQIALLHYLWPLFVLGPGVLLIYFAWHTSSPDVAQGILVPGSILTMLGLLLWYQTLSGHWTSWAYAWALLPLSIGLGQMVYGHLRGVPNLKIPGRSLVQVFGVIFILGFFFFEMILNISGLGIWAWSAVFIGTGSYLVWRSLRSRAS